MKQAMKTRCFYSEYVNHMIRFFLTCPDGLITKGKRRADIENWIAVQGVLHGLPEDDRVRVVDVYRTHYNLPKAVDLYCQRTGAEQKDIWPLLVRVAGLIARHRGLI